MVQLSLLDDNDLSSLLFFCKARLEKKKQFFFYFTLFMSDPPCFKVGKKFRPLYNKALPLRRVEVVSVNEIMRTTSCY